MRLKELDIVYPLKTMPDKCEELKYSLRSLKNFPHRRVFVIGNKPQ